MARLPSFGDVQLRKRAGLVVAYLPGLLFSITVGMAATFISSAYGGPTVLFALLLGMAFNFISKESRLAPGVAFSSRTILRIGVAALGARITARHSVHHHRRDDLKHHSDGALSTDRSSAALHPRAKRRVSRRHHS